MKQLLSIFILFYSITCYSQVKDTTYIHSPKKATIKSTILPGLGQAYNKKYWKIPLIYGAIGGLIYSANIANTNFNEAETAFVNLSNGMPITGKYNVNGITTAQISADMEYYRRNRDFSYILLGLTYILNIVDANVDAHLLDFNVSDDLSIKLEPSMQQNAYIGINNGLKLSMIF